MKSIEKLEENYKRELELAEKHRQNAIDIKKEIEFLKGSMINQKARTLNLSSAEYDRFIKMLESGRSTVMEAIELVIGKAPVQIGGPDGKDQGKGDVGDADRSTEG